MVRVKVFSNYNFIESGKYHCPSCGCLISVWSKVKSGVPFHSPLGKLEEYLLECEECDTEIDYLLSLKPH